MSPRSRGRLRLALPVLVLFVKALARLHAQVTRQDHALEEWGRSPGRIAELVEERVRDVQVYVKTGVVDELEGPHRVPRAELHGLVDVLRRSDALFERADRLEHDRDHQTVDDEARRVLADDRRVTQARDERAQGLH